RDAARKSASARSSPRVHRASVGPASWPDAVETSGSPPYTAAPGFGRPLTAIPRQPARVPRCPLRVILPFRPVHRRPNGGSSSGGPQGRAVAEDEPSVTVVGGYP